MPGLSTGDLHFGPVRCIIIQENFASDAAGNMKAASGNTEKPAKPFGDPEGYRYGAEGPADMSGKGKPLTFRAFPPP